MPHPVQAWASNNNLKLNCSKSKEIVFRARGGRGKIAQLPSPCEGIERVDKLTILGVVVNSRLTATDHVDGLMSTCSSLLYARTAQPQNPRNITERRLHCDRAVEAVILCSSLVGFLYRSPQQIESGSRHSYDGVKDMVIVTRTHQESVNCLMTLTMYCFKACCTGRTMFSSTCSKIVNQHNTPCVLDHISK